MLQRLFAFLRVKRPRSRLAPLESQLLAIHILKTTRP